MEELARWLGALSCTIKPEAGFDLGSLLLLLLLNGLLLLLLWLRIELWEPNLLLLLELLLRLLLEP